MVWGPLHLGSCVDSMTLSCFSSFTWTLSFMTLPIHYCLPIHSCLIQSTISTPTIQCCLSSRTISDAITISGPMVPAPAQSARASRPEMGEKSPPPSLGAEHNFKQYLHQYKCKGSPGPSPTTPEYLPRVASSAGLTSAPRGFGVAV